MGPGTFKAKPVDAVLAQTSKGTEFVGVTFEVTEGDCIGERITASLWWTPKTEERTRADLRKLGWQDGVKNVDGHAHLVLVPNPIAIGVKEDEYNGKTSLKVDWIGSPPSGVRDEDKLSGRAAADLLARLKGQAPTNGRAAPSSRSHEYVQGTDASTDFP